MVYQMKKTLQQTGLALTFLSGLAFVSCNSDGEDYDASGAFEAVETIVSSETEGTIEKFNVEEGQILKAGREVGYVDSLQLYLKKKQLEAKVEATLGRQSDIPVQLSALQEKLRKAKKEKRRFSRLVEGDAATPKQLDDAESKVDELKKQIAAQKSKLNISNESISKEAVPLQIQMEQVEDKLRKSRITNPINGTVLTKYAEESEMTSQGKPLYKIADLSSLILRVYVTGNQLSKIRLNQNVNVYTDDGNGDFNEAEGKITWISDKAEFTPKTIQTKEERADKVYAVKVKVDNEEGLYKIGMYGQIKF